MGAALLDIKVLLGTALLVFLVGCRNGDQRDGAKAGNAPGPDGAGFSSGSPPAAQDGGAGLWLGDRSVPISAQSASIEGGERQGADAAIGTWRVKAGDSVAGTVRRWADAAGYTPVPRFSTNEAWSFIVTQEFTGTFDAALAWLSNGFQRQSVKPVAVLYANHTLDLIDQKSAAVVPPTISAAAEYEHDGGK